MENLNLNNELQQKYVEMHDLVVKAKYYFLKVLQSSTVSDHKKNELRDKLIELSEEIKNHQNKIKYSKINEYNFEEYKKMENKYLRKTKKKLVDIIKKCKRTNPTRIKYNRNNIKENEMDEDLENSKIYGTRALERDKIININKFNENIIKNEIQKRSTVENTNKKNRIDDELLKIKTENFVKKMRDREAVNPEIYYKAVKAIENRFLENNKMNIESFEKLELKEKLNNNELYIFFDNYYNIIIKYRNDNFYIEVAIILIGSVIEHEIVFTNGIYSKTCVGEEEITAKIPINNDKKCTVSSFNERLNEYLEELEIRLIYDKAVAAIRDKINSEKNKEKIEMERTKTEVNKKLNEML